MSTTEDDYDSNTSISPIKKYSKGVSYKGMYYYNGNRNSCTFSSLPNNNYDNDSDIFDGSFSTKVNKLGIKVLFTGKRLKYVSSCERHCKTCKRQKHNCQYLTQKYNDKQFQSIIKDAFYEGDSD